MHTSSTPADDLHGRWLLAAVLLSAVAAGLHVLATPEHFEEWVGYGLFFITAAAAQGVYAILLLFVGPRRGLLWLGIVGNLLIIGLYLVTRTVGIPFLGPEAGEVEAVGWLDLASKAVELGLIVCLVQLLRLAAAPKRSG